VYGLRLVDFGIGTIAVLLTGVISAGLLGLIGVLTLAIEGRLKISCVLFSLFAACFIGPLAVLIAIKGYRRKTSQSTAQPCQDQHQSQFKTYLHTIIRRVNVAIERPGTIAQFTLINLLINLVLATRFWVIGRSLGYSFDYAAALVLQSAGQLSSIMSLLPSGTIGLREAFVGLGAFELTREAATGVMISVVDRIVATVWILLFGSISVMFMQRRIARAEHSELKGEDQ